MEMDMALPPPPGGDMPPPMDMGLPPPPGGDVPPPVRGEETKRKKEREKREMQKKGGGVDLSKFYFSQVL